MKVYKHTKIADGLWNIKGSFGEFDAEVKSGRTVWDVSLSVTKY